MNTRHQSIAHGTGRAPLSTWMLRLAVFVVVAVGLSIVGMLAVVQTNHRQPISANLRFVSATIETASQSEEGLSLDAWRTEILSPANVHTAIAELRLDHSLLPRGEKVGSPVELEARIQGLLQVDVVRDRRHADNQIRITFPVGRNVSEAVALVNGLAQQTVTARVESARTATLQADQLLLAKREATAQAATVLQQLQSELAEMKKSSPREEVADKNSVAVDAYFDERRAQLSLELAEFQRRREVLLETLLPAHPEVRALDSKIDIVRGALAQIPPAKNTIDTLPLPGGADPASKANDGKLLADISRALGDWQYLSAEQAAAEQLWQTTRTIPSYVISLAQVPIVPVSGDRFSTAVLSFVVLAAMAVGIAAAGWVRPQPIILRSTREIEKSLHLKVLTVLPSAGVKI